MKFDMSFEASQTKAKLAAAKVKAADKGFSFEGNETRGSFEGGTPLGRVKGAYTVDGGMIHFVVDKPWLVPDAVVRDAVEKFMG